jgi:hypothetical protein
VPANGLPDVFVRTLADRVSAYTGHGRRDVLAALELPRPSLPAAVGDLLLEPMRQHLDAVDRRSRDDVEREYFSARRRLENELRDALSRVSGGAGSALERQASARTDAERTFATSLRVVQPVALAAREPRAVRAELAVRLESVDAPSGLAPGRTLDTPQLRTALDEVGTNAHRSWASPREHQAEICYALWDAAGQEDPAVPAETLSHELDPSEAMRRGTAFQWARSAAPEAAQALGLNQFVPGIDDVAVLPQRDLGAAAAGFAAGLAEATGGRPREALDEMCSAMDLGADVQWRRAARRLAPDLAPEQNALVATAMRDGYGRGLRALPLPATLDDWTAVGAGAVAAGRRQLGDLDGLRAATAPSVSPEQALPPGVSETRRTGHPGPSTGQAPER